MYLNKFIVQNRELEMLEARIKEFNPLRVLKVNHYEIRHSNILSWLLNPNESHNLGDKFLKKVLSEIILRNENTDTSLSIMQIQNANLSDAEVLREHLHVDILVISETNKLVLVIENKLLSSKVEGQVTGYVKAIKQKYPGYQVIPILLSLTSEEIQDSGKIDYATITHEDLYNIIKFLIELHKDSLNKKIYDFINYYLKALEEFIMYEDNEVVKLCKEIYQKHKDAIDAIMNYGVTTQLDAPIEEFKKGKSIAELYKNVSSLWFIPKELENIMPKMNEGWVVNYPICFRFQFSTKKDWFGLILEIGPFKDPQKRIELLKLVKRSHIFRVPDRSLEPERKYTRIFSKYIDFKNWDDNDEILKKMNDLYLNKAKDVTAGIIKLVKQFEW
jgi:hypothetical protein